MSDWKSDLNDAIKGKDARAPQEALERAKAEADAELFAFEVVKPAFDELQAEFERRGRIVAVNHGYRGSNIIISHNGKIELDYTLLGEPHSKTATPRVEVRSVENGRASTALPQMRYGAQDYTVKEITKDEIINHVINQYILSRGHS